MLLNHPKDSDIFEDNFETDEPILPNIAFPEDIGFDSDDEKLLLSKLADDGLSDEEIIRQPSSVQYGKKLEKKKQQNKNNLPSNSCHVGVVVRVRPPESDIDNPPEKKYIDVDMSRTHLNLKLFDNVNHSFVFDYVVDEKETQMSVMEVSKPYVDEVLKGHNVSILACGGMNSGKSYTLNGLDTKSDRGLILRSMEHICQRIKGADSNSEYVIGVNYINIDEDVVSDLLSPRNKNIVIHNQNDNLIYQDATTIYIRSSEDIRSILKLIPKGENRKGTQIFRMNIARHDLGTGENTFNNLSFVRLSSYNQKQKNTLTARIRSLTEGIDMKRDTSPISKVLSNLLGGNCKALVLCCVNASHFDMENSLISLEICNRMMKIVNYPSIFCGRSPTEEKLIIAMEKIKKQEEELTILRQEREMYKAQNSITNHSTSEKETILTLKNTIKDLQNQLKLIMEQYENLRQELSRSEKTNKELERECHLINTKMRSTVEKLNIIKYDKEKTEKIYVNKVNELNEKLEKAEKIIEKSKKNFETKYQQAKVDHRDRIHRILSKAESVVKKYSEKRKETLMKQNKKNELRSCIKAQILEIQQLEIDKMKVESKLNVKIQNYVDLKARLSDKKDELITLKEQLNEKNYRLEQQHKELLGLAKLKVESDIFHRAEISRLQEVVKFLKSSQNDKGTESIKGRNDFELMQRIATPLRKITEQNANKRRNIPKKFKRKQIQTTEFDLL